MSCAHCEPFTTSCLPPVGLARIARSTTNRLASAFPEHPSQASYPQVGAIGRALDGLKGQDALMRTWNQAERFLRRETAVNVSRPCGPMGLPLVAAVGHRRPAAVIALNGLDLDRPSRTIAEFVMLSAAFRPARVLVGLAIPHESGSAKGLLVTHDVQAVADGLVEVQRVWGWHRLGRWVMWPPVEVRRWEVCVPFTAAAARAILTERPPADEPAMLEALLARSVAAGHRIRLSSSLRHFAERPN